MAQWEQQPVAPASLDKSLTAPAPNNRFQQNLPGSFRAEPIGPEEISDIRARGFPYVELLGLECDKNPWLQPASSHTAGRVRFKKDPRCGETVADQLHQQEMRALTPEQRSRYETEEDALYNNAAQAEFAPCPMPASPMHDLVNARLLDTKLHIEQLVKNQMTAAELAALEQGLKGMDDQYLDWRTHFNPSSAGDSGPHIEPDPAVLIYFERIANAVGTRDITGF